METREKYRLGAERTPAGRRLLRLLPLVVIVLATLTICTMGWQRQLSIDGLVRHRAAVESFVAAHHFGALALFAGIYVVAVTLSLPGAVFLTVAGGLVFGTVVGGATAILAATLGATLVFLIARSALGGWLVRHAGAAAERLADGFRRDAFHYLLFLRLAPIFPFWLVNLVPALVGVRLSTFVLATILGVVPATFAFAFLGAGLDSAVAAQAEALHACLADRRTPCPVQLDLETLMTPELIAAFVVLGLVALVPVAIRRLKPLPAGRSA